MQENMYAIFIRKSYIPGKAISHSINNDYHLFYFTFIISRDFACLSGFDD